MRLEGDYIVIVSHVAVLKLHTLSGLRQQKSNLSQFWRPEVQSQGQGSGGGTWANSSGLFFTVESGLSQCNIRGGLEVTSGQEHRGFQNKMGHFFKICRVTRNTYGLAFPGMGGGG